MGWGSLPEPGTEHGPCVGACEHLDCAETRRMAASICRICNTQIGYETPFYTEDNNKDKWVHADCLHAEADGKPSPRLVKGLNRVTLDLDNKYQVNQTIQFQDSYSLKKFTGVIRSIGVDVYWLIEKDKTSHKRTIYTYYTYVLKRDELFTVREENVIKAIEGK